MERFKKAIFAGSTPRLGTLDRKRVAFVVFNSDSSISALVLDLDGTKTTNAIWFKEKTEIGLMFREKLFDLGA